MNVTITPFQLDGCNCRLKFDPKELQEFLHEDLTKKVARKSKVLDRMNGELTVQGTFTEIDEGNFALHLMLAFLGKAWISGTYQVSYNGEPLLQESFRMNKTFAVFTNGRGQLKGDIKILNDQIVKKTLKALKKVA